MYLAYNARVFVTDGALLELAGNSNCAGGGIMMGHHSTKKSTLHISGKGTRAILQNNTSGECNIPRSEGIRRKTEPGILDGVGIGGGGISAMGQGDSVTITNGSALIVQGNTATRHNGGGMAFSHGTLLLVSGVGTTLTVVDNTAKKGNGGGIAVFSRAILSIKATTFPGSPTKNFSTVFRGNAAPQGDGGAIAFVHAAHYESADGSSSCVPVLLHVEAKVKNSYSPSKASGGSPQIGVKTEPTSAIDSRDWRVLVNASGEFDGKKTTEYCLPCGNYTLMAEARVGFANCHHGEGSLVSLKLAVSDPNTAELARLTGRVKDMGVSAYSPEVFTLNCADQGVTIAGALFDINQAKRGGALGMAPNRKNSMFTVLASSFIGNMAGTERSSGAKGGVAVASGINSGLSFTNGCVFQNNRVRGSGGLGGALAVEDNAGLRISDATAVGNTAQGEGSLGGFLFARFASPILFQHVTIEKSTAGAGGGALALLTGSRIALETVKIAKCSANGAGGGGILLDEGSEAHLIDGCELVDNIAKGESGQGGHVRVAASKLVVHAAESSLEWPASKPMFQDTITLGSNYDDDEAGPVMASPSLLIRGTAAKNTAGAIFCTSCLICVFFCVFRLAIFD
jgi:hypothetical protein